MPPKLTECHGMTPAPSQILTLTRQPVCPSPLRGMWSRAYIAGASAAMPPRHFTIQHNNANSRQTPFELRGVTATGSTDTGTVSEFGTRGCTATRHRGVAGFRGVVSSLPVVMCKARLQAVRAPAAGP
jgi:hypothetical protein